MWIVLGYWEKAIVTAVLAALVFSTTLLALSIATRNHPWRAFWIANLALAAFFGGIELFGIAVIGTSATRFGGAPLSVDGHITLAGLASLFLDVGICVLSNFFGFSIARFLIARLNL
jgi:hypothetical protein